MFIDYVDEESDKGIMIRQAPLNDPSSLHSALGRVVGELTRVRGCHTVILFGSRARGDADADSDVDLLGIGGGLVDGPLFRVVDGFDFDIWIADESSVEKDLEEYLKIEDGRPLVQRASYGDELLRRVKARVSAGPSPLTDEERSQRLRWLQRMASRAGRGDGEGCYRLLWLAAELPRIRFELADRYWLGPKRSLAALAELDPGFLELYNRLLFNPSPVTTEACVRYLAGEGPPQ
jgi:predicted nucleotidyltransferase